MQAAPHPAETATLRTLFAQGQDQQLEDLARSCIARHPASGSPWNMLGALRQRQRQNPEAILCYRNALLADPQCVEACFNLGHLLQQNGSLKEAVVCYQHAVLLSPCFLKAWFSLGVTLNQLEHLRDAEAAFRRVLELDPDLAPACNNLAITQRRQARPAHAEESCRRAIAIQPDYAEAWCNLGSALQDQGKLTEAIDSYRRAIRLRPDLPIAHQSLLLCLSHGCESTPAALFAEHRAFAASFEQPLRSSWPGHLNVPDPHRPLRIGFVSGDFREHAMAYFIEPTIRHLAQQPALTLHAYSNYAVEDAVTTRIRPHFARWHSIAALSDEALAAQIQSDGIDILIDLAGHTANSRLLTFARKPAPVQCGWIGYLGTSGLQSIDYYLADPIFLPHHDFAPHFTEQLVHLPAVAAFQPSPDAPPVTPLPALTRGHLTFGSFSRLNKLNADVIALWSRLLRELPSSSLVIGGMPHEGKSDLLTGMFRKESIAADRLHFQVRGKMQQYLASLQTIDLCLDPFPFSGATTTCHALWMGVPTLSLRGNTPAGRLGAALLHHVGLDAFVASSPDDFLAKGLVCAADLQQLSETRHNLRDRFAASPLGQPELIAISMAAAFRQMWRRWCHASATPS